MKFIISALLAACLTAAAVRAHETVEDQKLVSLIKPALAKDRQRQICLSEQCIAASHRLFQTMNLKADPCQDFNEFACGKFVKEFRIPEDKSRWNAFTPVSEDVYERGRDILEEEDQDGDWNVFKQAKSLYKSCMNEEKLEELGVQPLIDSLKDIDGWPVIEGEEWSEERESNFKWWEKIYKMNKIGYGSGFIVSLGVGTDDKDSSRRALFLDQPSLGLSREYLVKGLDDKDVKKYFKYMTDMAVLLGASQENAEKELFESLKFEFALAKASAPKEERRNATLLYNPFIIKDYEALEGHPDSWHEYIDNVIYTQDIKDDETVIVNNPKYIKDVANIINETPSKVIANYLGWRAVKGVSDKLNQASYDIVQEYTKALYGTKTSPPRWKRCAKKVGFNAYSGGFHIAAGTMYVKKHFPQEAKDQMLEMTNYLRKSFHGIIEDLDWMDDETKTKAQEKLNKMGQFIGYPEEILDEEIVEGFYEGLSMDESKYFDNLLSLARFRNEYYDSRLREPVDKNDWRDNSFVALVNAFYSFNQNYMKFPAGILQGVFFNHEVPRYMNFGAIGAVIGHEITHGFDDQGRQYDLDGNLKNWWDEATGKKYVERAKCIVDQYSNFYVEQVDMNLNGVANQGENIADNGGIKEAYGAYGLWEKDNGHEAILPGFDFTPKQLFWISYGQVWCAKYRDATLKLRIATGSHSPGPYRILGPLSNNEDFANDFKCAKGTPMNPEDKCSVW